ncbi:MAG: DUF4340 domain-containing protein [Magnetococcales bacterium]|nr:DUF4340 domain-containing protein [Magnetococcales bacterium]MBF0438118.1 DUF4340 domain-containing protein [Magnetococcales bacterium]
MTKGWRNNLILALVMAGAAGGLWILDSREAARTEADKLSRAVSAIRTDAVVSADFWDETGDNLSLSRKGDQWEITAPSALRTSASAVKSLLEVLSKTYEKKVVDQITDAAPFGLLAPAARLTVKDGSGKTLSLIVGNTAPASKQRYMSLGEKGPVVLMPAADVSGLLQKTDALRDKRLVATEAQDVTRLLIKSKTKGETLLIRDKDKEEVWTMETPVRDLADTNRIRTWMFALTGAQGMGFKSERPEGDGDWIVELTPTKGEVERVVVWRSKPDLLVARSGEADLMVMPQYLAEEFDKNALDLVSLRPLDPKFDLTHLQFEQDGKTLTAEKKEGKWPASAWTDLEEILTRDAYHGATPKGDAAPWLKITAGKGEKAVSFMLHQEKKSIFISPPSRPVALELTPLQAETLQKAVTTLLNPPASQP